MASVTLDRSRPVAVREPRKVVPVKWWAVAGVIAIALQAGIFFHWIFISGNFNETDTGPAEISSFMSASLWFLQTICIVLGIWCLYWFFFRRWKQGEPLGIDSYMIIGIYLVWWQDPILNYFQNWATYNAYTVQRGSWSSSIPGWLAPNSHNMAAPLLFTIPVYGAVAFVCSLTVAKAMRAARNRYPHVGNVGIVAIGFAICSVIVFACETAFLRLGIYAYPGAIEWMTIFHGEYYQYPLYEWLIFTSIWTTWASILFFRNDKGETVAERGLEELRAKTGKRLDWVRLLSVVGVVNVSFFLVYNLPLQPFALHAEEWPEVFQERTFMLNEMCGTGTDIACSGTDIPIPREGGFYVTTDGTVGQFDD